MKKFLCLIYACIGIVGIAIAETLNVTWYNVDGTTYDTTTCTVGGTLTLPTTPTRYGYTFKGWAVYTPIEYIEGVTGAQYIDTGIVPISDMSLYVKFSIETMVSNNYIPYGARNGNSDTGLAAFMSAVGLDFDFFNGSLANRFSPSGVTPILHKIYETSVVQAFLQIKLDNQLIAEHQFYPQANASTIHTIYVNALNNNGTPDTRFLSTGRIYRFTINGIIDLIPVLDHNGVACMYDKVSKTFFYNAGTGNFIAGPAI